MKGKIKRKWMAALRSGKYKQGKGCLRRGRKFCCLGVLCDLYVKERRAKWEKSTLKEKGLFALLDVEDILPDRVKEWAGLASRDPRLEGKLLSVRNDDGQSFKDMAKLIRKHL